MFKTGTKEMSHHSAIRNRTVIFSLNYFWDNISKKSGGEETQNGRKLTN